MEANGEHAEGYEADAYRIVIQVHLDRYFEGRVDFSRGLHCSFFVQWIRSDK